MKEIASDRIELDRIKDKRELLELLLLVLYGKQADIDKYKQRMNDRLTILDFRQKERAGHKFDGTIKERAKIKPELNPEQKVEVPNGDRSSRRSDKTIRKLY